MPPEIIAVTRQIRALWRQFDWLPEWAVIGLVLLVFVGGGWLTHKIAFAILRRVVRNKDLFWRGVVERARVELLQQRFVGGCQVLDDHGLVVQDVGSLVDGEILGLHGELLASGFRNSA